MIVGSSARRVITPVDLPVVLGGHTGGSYSSRVDSDLEVNVLCLEDGMKRIVLISLDLLYVTQDLRCIILQGLQCLGLDEASVFTAASHTHSAPAIDRTKPLLGTPDGEYLHFVAEQTIACVRECLTAPSPEVRVTAQRGRVNIGTNRRYARVLRFSREGVQWNRVGMAPNASGITDPTVTIIQVRSGGQMIACIWSAACHPTGIPDRHQVSSDWPGKVRDGLRLAFGSGTLPILFFQGFSGDVRPPSGTTDRGLPRLLRRALLGPVFASMTWTEYLEWARSVTLEVCQILRTVPIEIMGTELSSTRLSAPALLFAGGAESLPSVSFHMVRIGTIDIVGASAELVSGYAYMLREMSPRRLVVPVGCIDHVIGYWPTAQMISEGGYEVDGHCQSFGITRCAESIQERVLQGFDELLDSRRPPSQSA